MNIGVKVIENELFGVKVIENEVFSVKLIRNRCLIGFKSVNLC